MMDKNISEQVDENPHLLARMMGNTFIRFATAVFGGLIATIILLLLMKFLITGNKEGKSVFGRLFSLNTVVIGSGQGERVARPIDPNTLPDISYDEIDIKQETEAFLENQSNEQLLQPDKDNLQEILRKKNEIISILESDPEE